MSIFGGGFDGFDGGDDHVIELTADKDFDIHAQAKDLAALMRETEMDLVLHLRHVSVEFEAGCTAREIIDGYFYAMRQKGRRRPSNGNLPLELVPV